jgi:endonuclease/exonuclease/phosphatase family metal-dependent hydrolase
MAPRKLTIATYNTHHGEGTDGTTDMNRTAAALAATNAQLVALQELDRGVQRSGGEDQPAKLAQLAAVEVRFFPTLQNVFGEGGQFGIGVAAAGPIDAEFHPLPRTGEDRPHGLVIARWEGITLIGTHLSRYHATRTAEMTKILSMAATIEGPTIVAGDFNDVADNLHPLLDAGFKRWPKTILTFSANNPRRQIDHILAGPGVRIVRSWAVKSQASDHLPLVAEIEVA